MHDLSQLYIRVYWHTASLDRGIEFRLKKKTIIERKAAAGTEYCQNSAILNWGSILGVICTFLSQSDTIKKCLR